LMFGLFYGLFKYLFSKAEYSIPLLGLDGSGKTTLTERIKSIYTGIPPPENVTPTIGLNVRRVELGHVKLRLWDLSGESGMRKIWPNYYEDADGIVYCVDATDRERLHESKQAFDSVVNSGILKSIPLLFLINKIDKENAMDKDQIREYFEIEELLPTSIRVFRIITCSAIDGSGLRPGIEWLGEYMRNHIVSKEKSHL